MKVDVRVLLLLSCFTSWSASVDNGDTFSFQQGASFSVNASSREVIRPDLLARFTLPSDRIASSLRFRYETLRGKRIYVFDNLFKWEAIKALQIYVSTAGWWRYVSVDPYHSTQEELGDNIQWAARFGAVTFANTRLGVGLRQAIQVTSRDDVPYYPFEVICKVVRRGDDTRLHVHANESDDEYTTVVYLNDKWRKNDYGDMLLFDEEMEIVAPVKPQLGRTIVWHSSVPYLSRPPSIAFRMGQKLLFIRWTKNVSKVSEYENQRVQKEQFIRKGRDLGFALHDEPPESASELNIADYETGQYSTKQGQKIFVFDELFNRTELDLVRSYIIDHGKYYYDDSLDHDSDNVQWISGYEVDAFVLTKYWGIVRQVANYVSGGLDSWFPYDVSCNLIRVTDYTRIHLDCEETANEWTFLLYLNPNWGENDYGETAFFETTEDDTELVTEVRPKYGRVTIFHGTIPHSARPPSPAFLGGRYSLAVKVAPSLFKARGNTLREKWQHQDNLSQLERLLTLLEQGKMTEHVQKFVEKTIMGIPSEADMNKLERGIIPEEDGEDGDSHEHEDRDDQDDDEEEEGFHDDEHEPSDTMTEDGLTQEEIQIIEFLQGNEENYHDRVHRIVKSLHGDVEAINSTLAKFDENYERKKKEVSDRLEALL